MSWVAVDEGLPDHPKILALGSDAPAGLAMFVAALCWSGQHGTDGIIPTTAVHRLVPNLLDVEGYDDSQRIARLLGHVKLFDATDEGWCIPDWTDYQRTKDERDELRRKRQEAGRAGGFAKAARAAGKRLANDESAASKSNSDSGKRLANGWQTAGTGPDLTLPDLTGPKVFAPQSINTRVVSSLAIVTELWERKAGRRATRDDVASITRWLKTYGRGLTEEAIGEAQMQGHPGNNDYIGGCLKKWRAERERGKQ